MISSLPAAAFLGWELPPVTYRFYPLLLGSIAGLSLAWFVRELLVGAGGRKLGRAFTRRAADFDGDLKFVRAPFDGRTLLGLQLAFLLGAVVGTLLGDWRFCALSFGAALPPVLLARERAKRVAALERQIEGWLGSLSRALEAAPSLGEALEVSATMSRAPLSEELATLLNEMRLGLSLERTLKAWGQRVNSRVLSLVLSTLLVGRQTGGGISQALDETAGSLREMERLEGVIRTKTAEGKAQAWVISVLPVPVYFGVKMSDPHFFDPLGASTFGHLMLALAAVLWAVAAFSAKKILAVRV